MGKFAPYKIQLSSIADGKYEQDFYCGTEFFKNMENTDVISSDVNIHLDMEKKNGVYDCTFTCKGMLHIPCDRCLDPLDHEVDTTYHIIVKYGDSFNDESDEILIIPEGESSLNVAYMLYDTIVLTIPLRHVHPLGKCNRAMAAALNKHKGGMSMDDEDVEEAFESAVEMPDPDSGE